MARWPTKGPGTVSKVLTENERGTTSTRDTANVRGIILTRDTEREVGTVNSLVLTENELSMISR